MGIETEYGISVPGQPGANAMVTSSQVVNAYLAASAAKARRARWDFEEENPLRDARGFDLAREVADPTQLTDEDLGLANVILTNGARLYVDHAHPEYSTPECTNPRDAVIWDKAGERVMADAARRAAQVPGTQPIRVQSMTTTRTQDVEATLAQSIRLVDAGCEIVRITAPTVTDAQAEIAIDAAINKTRSLAPLPLTGGSDTFGTVYASISPGAPAKPSVVVTP